MTGLRRLMAATPGAGSATFTAGTDGDGNIGYTSPDAEAALGSEAMGSISDPDTAFGTVESIQTDDVGINGTVLISSTVSDPSNIIINGNSYTLTFQFEFSSYRFFSGTFLLGLVDSETYEWSLS